MLLKHAQKEGSLSDAILDEEGGGGGIILSYAFFLATCLE